MSQDLGYESLPKLFNANANKDGTSTTTSSPPKNAPIFSDVVKMRHTTSAGRRKKKKRSAVAVEDCSSVCLSGSEWDSCHNNRDAARNERSNKYAERANMIIADRSNVAAADNDGGFVETSGRSSVASDSNYSSPESQLWDKVTKFNL